MADRVITCANCGEIFVSKGTKGPPPKYCNRVTCNATYRNMHISRVTLTHTRMMYGWSKHGGPNQALVKQSGDWCCQCCGQQQTEELNAYMFEMDLGMREFFRICAKCKKVALEHNVHNFFKLIDHARHRSYL